MVLSGALLAPGGAAAQSLEERVQALEEQTAKKDKEKKESDIVVKWEPAPSIKSADGNFEMNIRGRLFLDAGFVSDKDGSMDVDATEARTARLGIEGLAWKTIKYKFEIDFADNEVDVKDAYLQWKSPIADITLGQFKTPNSLEELTSSRYITFVERASFTDAFLLERMLGIGFGWGGEANDVGWSLSLGAFRGNFGTGDDQEGTVLAARGTLGPKFNDVQLHIGGSVRYQNAGEGQALFRYRQRPHAHLSAERFVDTRAIAEEDLFYGAEAALVFGPFSVQGEYAWNRADLAPAFVMPGFDDPTFSGGYVDVSFFITGESRAYEADSGEFGRIKVNKPVFQGGPGAWQVAYRYDMIDLNDEAIRGGEQDTHIVGVNWHLNRHTRIMYNYNRSKVTDANGSAGLIALNGLDGENVINGHTIRAQVDW
jgi:phosphate-selective porin OprO/OprP